MLSASLGVAVLHIECLAHSRQTFTMECPAVVAANLWCNAHLSWAHALQSVFVLMFDNSHTCMHVLHLEYSLNKSHLKQLDI